MMRNYLAIVLYLTCVLCFVSEVFVAGIVVSKAGGIAGVAGADICCRSRTRRKAARRWIDSPWRWCSSRCFPRPSSPTRVFLLWAVRWRAWSHPLGNGLAWNFADLVVAGRAVVRHAAVKLDMLRSLSSLVTSDVVSETCVAPNSRPLH